LGGITEKITPLGGPVDEQCSWGFACWSFFKAFVINRQGWIESFGISSLPVCLTLFCLFWWKWWCLYFVVFFSCDDFMGGDLISVFFLVLVHFASRA